MVDLPTFGKPTMPHLKPILSFNAGENVHGLIPVRSNNVIDESHCVIDRFGYVVTLFA